MLFASIHQPTMNKRFFQYSFLLAFLLHILLLSFLVVRWVPVDLADNQHTPQYVPAYTYSAPTPAAYQASSQSVPSPTQQAEQEASETKPTPKQSEVSETARNAFLNESSWYPKKTVMQSSKQIIQNTETQETLQDRKNIEPMLMIGDSSQASDPIVQILGRALSAHFRYPKMEDAFRVSGRVIVSMVLHPEGNFTNVRIIESSNNQNFDNAALLAVNAAHAKGAERFLKEPKYFVVGFLFGGDPKAYQRH